ISRETKRNQNGKVFASTKEMNMKLDQISHGMESSVSGEPSVVLRRVKEKHDHDCDHCRDPDDCVDCSSCTACIRSRKKYEGIFDKVKETCSYRGRPGVLDTALWYAYNGGEMKKDGHLWLYERGSSLRVRWDPSTGAVRFYSFGLGLLGSAVEALKETAGRSGWSTIQRGPGRGMSLPEFFFSDPACAFTQVIRKRAEMKDKRLKLEAKELALKSKLIRVRPPGEERVVVQSYGPQSQ